MCGRTLACGEYDPADLVPRPIKLHLPLSEMIDRVWYALLGFRFDTGSERALQDGIERAIRAECPGLIFAREAPLGSPTERIDFLIGGVGGVGLEAKIAGNTNEVLRQLLRYAHRPEIGALVLVTTRAGHRSIPATLQDKPVRVLHLMESVLA